MGSWRASAAVTGRAEIESEGEGGGKAEEADSLALLLSCRTCT